MNWLKLAAATRGFLDTRVKQVADTIRLGNVLRGGIYTQVGVARLLYSSRGSAKVEACVLTAMFALALTQPLSGMSGDMKETFEAAARGVGTDETQEESEAADAPWENPTQSVEEPTNYDEYEWREDFAEQQQEIQEANSPNTGVGEEGLTDYSATQETNEPEPETESSNCVDMGGYSICYF